MGTVQFLSKSTWQKFDAIQSSHKKVLCEDFNSSFKSATVSTAPGRAGRESCSKLCVAMSSDQCGTSPRQTRSLVRAAQPSRAILNLSESEQWPKQCGITTITKKDDLIQACPDNLSKFRTCSGSAPGRGTCCAKWLSSSRGLQPFLHLCSSEHLHPSCPDTCQLASLPYGNSWKLDLLCSSMCGF